MPEHPDPKPRTVPEPPTEVVFADVPYAELDVTSNFSFLRGASHPDELVHQAARLGYRALAVTDRNSLAGVVRAHAAAKGCGLKLIVGARLVLNDAPDLLVWCADRPAYARLCRLITLGRRRADKGQCALWLNDVLPALADAPGLLAALVPPEPLDPYVEHALAALRDATGGPAADRLSVATSCLYGGTEQTRLRDLVGLSRALGVPLVATNGVHYHVRHRRPLQDVLTCVRHGCSIQEAGYRLFPNGERYLKSPAQMKHVFAGLPDALARTVTIADRCDFKLSDLQYEYPDELVPPGRTLPEHLRVLTEAGAIERYPGGVPEKVRKLIEHELKLIGELKYEAYFLTVRDLVVYARSRGILCQGRGSAANSAVCYCLGVTSVDPNQIDLLFERFVSAARAEPPDIDVDFEHERREEVLQYLYAKYGRQRVGMTGVVITYRGRSAVRDVGKALGLSLDLVDQMAKRLEGWTAGAPSEPQLRELGLDPADRTVRQVVALTAELLGFPRHLSQHVGGMVMTRGPLCEMVPIENASMQDRTVIEWDKDDIDELKILKVDVLALGMLTCIAKAFKLIEGSDGATERRSDEGEDTQAIEGEDEHAPEDEREDVSRPDRVAEGQGAGEEGVRGDAEDARGRAVRFDPADASGERVDPVQHRGGARATDATRLPAVPPDRARIAGGTHDASGDRLGLGPDAPQRGTGGPSGRGGQDPSGAHQGFGEQAGLGSSSLRRSVAPSLRRSPLELHTVPREDPLVYDMICRADTVGVFQIESRAQMSMLPRLRPSKFYDLVIEVAIVRPGPIQGNMVHPYLRRRNKEEEVTYPSPALESVLACTLGVPLFQEQAMKVVMVAAGFSADEADRLRKAMAAWRRTTALETFRDKVIDGMLANGYDRAFAEQTFEQIRGFGEYGFPESHAASFALLVYVSCWLKRHHPAAFTAALLNSQPMGFYGPAQLVRDAVEHGVTVRAVDVNHSEWDCTLEGQDEHGEATEAQRHGGGPDVSRTSPVTNNSGGAAEASAGPLCLRASVAHSSGDDPSVWGRGGPAVRLGLRMVKGLRADHAAALVEARRRRGAFASVRDLRLRAALPKPTLKRLAEADAFQSIGLARREALWQVLGLEDEAAPLFDLVEECGGHGLQTRDTGGASGLPPMPAGQEVMTDYATAGLSLKAHPVGLVRDVLVRRRVITAAELKTTPAGKWVRVAGLVLIRQRPGTASGIVFETLEDETGIANLIVRPAVYDKYKQAAKHGTLVEAQGIVERQGDVIHVMVKKMEDLTYLVEGLSNRSRDFR
ncbi:MAG TPA: PHP domain-containing protein [Humisphaera sp.]